MWIYCSENLSTTKEGLLMGEFTRRFKTSSWTMTSKLLQKLLLKVLINGLQHSVSLNVKQTLQIVETFIKAYYLPETEYVHWARARPKPEDTFALLEHSKNQIVGLIDLVASMKVSGPCNGLLCLHNPSSHDDGKVALWNPSTREFKSLPQSTVQCPPSVDITSFGCLGFGFDSKSEDYKVEISVPEVEVYPFGSVLFNNYINGFYYWDAIEYSDDLILSFDMANEKFSTLPLPNFGGSLAQYNMELLNFNGSLGAIFLSK
ncbi:hypothetical protein CRYUN_Cryun02cG0176900 [Craigia yunnanensis]